MFKSERTKDPWKLKDDSIFSDFSEEHGSLALCTEK